MRFVRAEAEDYTMTIRSYDEAAHYNHILNSVKNENWQSFYEERKAEYKQALKVSCTLVVCEDEQYAGFLRAVTDGVFTLFVAEIVVDEAYRRKGFGRALIREASARYPSARIDLISDNDAFYLELGFHPVGGGMRRHDWY